MLCRPIEPAFCVTSGGDFTSHLDQVLVSSFDVRTNRLTLVPRLGLARQCCYALFFRANLLEFLITLALPFLSSAILLFALKPQLFKTPSFKLDVFGSAIQCCNECVEQVLDLMPFGVGESTPSAVRMARGDLKAESI